MEKAALLRLGVMVIVGLAVLTAVEYWVAIAHLGSPLLPLLAMVGLAKAVLILEYFMHLGKVFQPGEGGH